MKGFKAFIIPVEEPIAKIIPCGWGNGYVIIPKNHLFYKASETEIEKDLTVLFDWGPVGGITFTCTITQDFLTDYLKLHAKGRMEMVMGKILNKEDIGKYVIGFDTVTLHGSAAYGSKQSVVEETLELYNLLNNKVFNLNRTQIIKL